MPPSAPILLNDIHSRLNPTTVGRILQPRSLADLQAAIAEAAAADQHISIAGGRHAMARQQFGAGAIHIDTTRMNRVLGWHAAGPAGPIVIEAEAGILWPDLIAATAQIPPTPGTAPLGWAIAQKQTGADRLSLGGSLAANVHGRGLTMPPIVADVESFTLVDAEAQIRVCSRTQNAELFALAIGGYGLFGAIASVRLRLVPRRTLRREVCLADIEDAVFRLEAHAAAGSQYGDFQFAIDPERPDFLRRGVLSVYTAVNDEPIPPGQLVLTDNDWLELLHLAHIDKSAAFDRYAEHYLRTSGQLYHTDTHQLSTYIDDYHTILCYQGGGDSTAPASEMITELYVPRAELPGFMAASADLLRRLDADVIYGTVRVIEPDTETFLPWARARFACIVLNLHTPHTPAGIEATATACRGLIDLAAARRGSFYLTYHAFATPEQIDACHPRFRAMLDLKLRYDPRQRFRSDWYLRCREMLDPARAGRGSYAPLSPGLPTCPRPHHNADPDPGPGPA